MYMWTNNRDLPHTVLKILNRVLVNSAWQAHLPHVFLELIPILAFDHKLLISSDSLQQEYKYIPFWFEAMWLFDLTCKTVVKKGLMTPGICSPSHALSRQLEAYIT